MADQYGPWVRLWGIHRSQLPSEETGLGADLTPILASILAEGRSFIKDVPPHSASSASSSSTSTWKSKGTKRFSHSTAPVHLFERIVPAADLQATAQKYELPHLEGFKVRDENWILRRSVHEDAPSTGTASWDEWVTTFKDKHAETEKEFTPMVLSTRLLQRWDCAGIEVDLEGIIWTDWTLKLEESVHKMPAPLKNRVFPVFQVTCSARGSREVMIIQMALRDLSSTETEDGTVRGAYTSVEKLRGTDSGTEWIMGTVSDARGVLPAWLQRISVPGFIAKDVDMFLKWIPQERKKVKGNTDVGDGTQEKESR